MKLERAEWLTLRRSVGLDAKGFLGGFLGCNAELLWRPTVLFSTTDRGGAKAFVSASSLSFWVTGTSDAWWIFEDKTSGSWSVSSPVLELEWEASFMAIALEGAVGATRTLPPQPASVVRVWSLPFFPVRLWILLWNPWLSERWPCFWRLFGCSVALVMFNWPRAIASSNFLFLSSMREDVGKRFFRSAIQASRISGESSIIFVPWIGIDFL